MACFYLSFVYWILLMFRGWTVAALNIMHDKVHKIYLVICSYYCLSFPYIVKKLGYVGTDLKMPMTCILPICKYLITLAA